MLDELQAIAAAEQDDELVSDVIEACRLRRAFLFMCADGWFVVQPLTTPDRHLLVPAAFSYVQNGIDRYQATIIELAQRLDLSVIRFRSKRPGYRRKLPALGWQLCEDGQTWEYHCG